MSAYWPIAAAVWCVSEMDMVQSEMDKAFTHLSYPSYSVLAYPQIGVVGMPKGGDVAIFVYD